MKNEIKNLEEENESLENELEMIQEDIDKLKEEQVQSTFGYGTGQLGTGQFDWAFPPPSSPPSTITVNSNGGIVGPLGNSLGNGK